MYTIRMNRTTISFITAAFAILPFAVSAASVALTTPVPSATIMAASNVTFSVVPTDISYPIYGLQDSFANSSASVNNIEPGGRFSWTPGPSDVGTHVLTFTASGSDSSASVTQTIIVLPPPTMSIGALSPGSTVMPGSPLTFVVTAKGFTNPIFTAGGFPANPSVATNGIDSTGHFSWTPTLSDLGDYTITVYVSDALGHNASKSVSVHVGKGPSLAIAQLTPGSSVSPGQLLTFIANPSDFLPTGFSVRDSFPGTASSNNINLSGQFSWSPASSDVGVHVLTVTGVVGAYGASASTTLKITVLGPGGVAPVAATTTGSSDTLAALQAKLASLQGALATQSAASTHESGSGSFTTYLRPGSTGDEVMHLQQVLAQLGFFSATPNGTYGPATTKAVMKFQAAHGLDQLGVVGPSTRAALNALGTGAASGIPTPVAQTNTYVFEHFMGIGDDDPDVLQLQQRLTALGFYTGEMTGYYGVATEAAVKKFQTARGISVTGYVARETRAVLNK